MNKKLIYVLIGQLGLFSFSLEATAYDRPHHIGIEGSVSRIDMESDVTRERLNDYTTLHGSLNYSYFFSQTIGFGVGWLKGDSEDGVFFDDLFTDSRLDYEALLIGPRFQLPLNDVNNLYLNINILQYDYDVFDDGRSVIQDDGAGYSAALGWQSRLRFGLGFKVGYEFLQLGSDVDIQGVQAGVSYSF